MNENPNQIGGTVATLLVLGFAWAATYVAPIFWVLSAVCLVIAVVLFMRSAMSTTCPACRSSVPKAASICRNCRAELAP